MDPHSTTSVHTRILSDNIVSDQDGCQYLLKYPDEAIILYNVGYLVSCQVIPTQYEINMESPQSPQLALQISVDSQYSFHGLANSEISAQHSVIPQNNISSNPTSFTSTSTPRLADLIECNSLSTKYNPDRISFSPC
jgi:hypothetical protein